MAKKSRIISTHRYKEKYGFKTKYKAVKKLAKGLSKETVIEISRIKNEPEWMLDIRLKAYRNFRKRPIPKWGVSLDKIDFDKITYYVKASEKKETSWKNVPKEIKETFEKLGVPEAERKFLAGVGAQFESEMVYHSIRKELDKKGVIFLDTDSALKQYPELFKKYFGTVVSFNDNKFASLNTAVWSGGTFIYVPKNVKVEIPLQAYFRMNEPRIGQFERTLIIADEGAEVHYIEGCTAPMYSEASLHAAVVEIIALKNSKVRYTTVQNWSKNVYNLVTKRAFAYENAVVEWIDGNFGSKATMKYPCVYLKGKGAKADILSIAVAKTAQHQDTGAKALHLASETTSKIISKSITSGKGRCSYRGMVLVSKGALNSKSSVKCDALLLDEFSRSDTYPVIKNYEDSATIVHEAFAGKISEDKFFYLQSRGINKQEAMALIVLGFISEFSKELPMDYALELNRLIRLEMENAVG